jgi:hypothetical protein
MDSRDQQATRPLPHGLKIDYLPEEAITLIRLYHKGRVFAVRWNSRYSPKEVVYFMKRGGIRAFPYNESTGEMLVGRSRLFR